MARFAVSIHFLMVVLDPSGLDRAGPDHEGRSLGQCLLRPAELQHQIATLRLRAGGSTISTESLILAQDERWRRA